MKHDFEGIVSGSEMPQAMETITLPERMIICWKFCYSTYHLSKGDIELPLSLYSMDLQPIPGGFLIATKA